MSDARYFRLSVVDPAGFEIVMVDGQSREPQHNANSQAPITIIIETQCERCLVWSERGRWPVPNW